MNSFDPRATALRLLNVRNGAAAVSWRDVLPPDRGGAYAVQDLTVRQLGVTGGWKVGAKSPLMEPTCAPLPAAGLLLSGASLLAAPWNLRGVEVEVAVRLGRDLDARNGAPDAGEILAAIEAVMPAIEVVETRLADWRESDPLAQLADLQSHGALVLGAPCTVRPEEIDLRTVQAHVTFDDQPVASTRGGNPAEDIWRMLGWLAQHCAQRGLPLRAGDVITTGSCTGMLFAPEGCHVQAELPVIGRVELWF